MTETSYIPIVLAFALGPIITPVAQWLKSYFPIDSPLRNLGIVGILNFIFILILIAIFKTPLGIEQILSMAFASNSASVGTHVIIKQFNKKIKRAKNL